MRDTGEALARIHAIIKKRNDIHIIHAEEISRQDRELLLGTNWLQEIIRGWYLLVRPNMHPGDSSGWYANFWDFLYIYLTHCYDDNYCLSAESSLDLHLGVTVVPKQVIVMAQKGRGNPLELPFDTSLLIYASKELPNSERSVLQRLQVMSLPYAICKVSPSFFTHQPFEAQIALQAITSSGELLKVITSHNFTRAAGRLVGAYRALKNEKMVEELLNGFASIRFKIQETNPFIQQQPSPLKITNHSPYAARIVSMWHHYRVDVIKYFSTPAKLSTSTQEYLEQVEQSYTQDAYHSLSIEGYRVSEELIEKVKNAKWNPDIHLEDQKTGDALNARGYYEAFQAVKKSLEKIFNGASPAEVVKSDLATWYQSLLTPLVKAGILNPSDLFGYRRHQVYIRNSRHTPLPAHALNEAMDAFFYCLQEEENAGVRAVLGHFIFVFIHPYMDGNGRIARLLMNVQLVSGGYLWKIVHVEHRKHYLNALEDASVNGNIVPFVKFLLEEKKLNPL